MCHLVRAEGLKGSPGLVLRISRFAAAVGGVAPGRTFLDTFILKSVGRAMRMPAAAVVFAITFAKNRTESRWLELSSLCRRSP